MASQCDVLIVGGGGAALRAAIAAHEAAPDARVVLVTKGVLGQTGVTATACSDRMAFHATLSTSEPGGPEAWRHHAEDIYRIGGHVSDSDLADVLARNAEEAFSYLDGLGVPWARRGDGTPDQFMTDGSTYARACYTGPFTANHIEAALLSRLRELPVRVVEGQMVGELLVDEGRRQVCGAALVSQEDGRITALGAKAIVLATGGAGQSFELNVFPPDCTGDGYALAYRAGADLVNLEFIQIGLCSLKTKLACSGSMMRALPRLVNDREEEFLPGYFAPGTNPARIHSVLYAKGASWPVSYREPSHIIDIAVAAEREAGRRVFLDYGTDPIGLNLSDLPEQVSGWQREAQCAALDTAAMRTPLGRLRAINPFSVAWLAERGINLGCGDRIEIAPAVQHFQGGIAIRTKGETTMTGLFAAGEVAGGQHGANRPGGNALLDAQVFGRIAGESAARRALAEGRSCKISDAEAQRVVRSLLCRTGADAERVREQVQGIMSRHCCVRRTVSGLGEAIERLSGLAECGVSGEGTLLARALETVNILQGAELVARAALERNESRGPHLRFPDSASLVPLARDDEHWNEYIIVRHGSQGPRLERRTPVRP